MILSPGAILPPNHVSHTTSSCVLVIASYPCLHWLRNSCWDRISRIGSTVAPLPNCATTMSVDIFRTGCYLEAALQRHVVMALPILLTTYQNNHHESSDSISMVHWCELGSSVIPPYAPESGLLDQIQVQECNGNSTFRFEWRFCQIRQAPHHPTFSRPAIESCQSQCRQIVESENIPCITHWSMIALFFHGRWAISARLNLMRCRTFSVSRVLCESSYRLFLKPSFRQDWRFGWFCSCPSLCVLLNNTSFLFWSVISENIQVILGHLLFGWASLRKYPELCATLLSLFISADTYY